MEKVTFDALSVVHKVFTPWYKNESVPSSRRYQDVHSQSYIMVIASGRWLGVRLDVIMSFFVGTVALAAVLGSQDAGRYIVFTQFCVLWQRNHFPSRWVVFVLKYKNKAHKNMDTKPRVVCQLNKLLTSRLKDDDLNKYFTTISSSRSSFQDNQELKHCPFTTQ